MVVHTHLPDEDMAQAGTTDALANGQEPLEKRVQRLEDAVAVLQDTDIIEERISERVVEKLNSKHPAQATTTTRAAHMEPTAGHGESATDAVASTHSGGENLRPTWVVLQVLREVRTALAMFFDSRSRVSWKGYFSLMILAYVLVSKWLWALWTGIPVIGLIAGAMNVPFFGDILDKAVDLLLILVAFTTLGREMTKYRHNIAKPASHL